MTEALSDPMSTVPADPPQLSPFALDCLAAGHRVPARTPRQAGRDARLLGGRRSVKDERTLCAACDDAAGVTAAINRNLLTRINRELGGMIDVDAFEHRAIWNGGESRIEMHLSATSLQHVELLGRHRSRGGRNNPHRELLQAIGGPLAGRLRGGGWRIATDWQSPPPCFLLALLEPADEGKSE